MFVFASFFGSFWVVFFANKFKSGSMKLKGLLLLFLGTFYFKPDSQQLLLNLYLVNNVEDMVVFLT